MTVIGGNQKDFKKQYNNYSMLKLHKYDQGGY